MTKQGHTPGPWTVERIPVEDNMGYQYRINSKVGWEVCRVNHAASSNQDAERYGNAYLIAAAPEMLKFLKNINWPMPEEEIPILIKLIAKAEGDAE